ncbi:MAG TPA: preprotein translocase subunit SecG [Burkholderiales bacterium]|jgi:preprotein translocase subunit SecG|nr:preprotein translocase subunit SecG [Burkholderiales bacterium]
MIGWTNVLIVLHVVVALAIIGLVLLQHGKGADMGSGFGGGASGSLFGATGSANFLSRTTAVLATLFFLLSLALAYVATHRTADDASVVDRVPAKAKPAAEAQKPAAEPQKPAVPAEAPSGKEVPR